MQLLPIYEGLFSPKIIFYDIGEKALQEEKKVLLIIKQTKLLIPAGGEFSSPEAKELYDRKMAEYNLLILKYKLLKLNTKKLLSGNGVRALHDLIQNLYLLYNTIRLNYLRTMGYSKVKVILLGDFVKKCVNINYYKIKSNKKNIRRKYRRKHETYKNLQRFRTVVGLKNLNLLPFATLNVKQKDKKNRRRLLRRSQVQMLYVDELTNRLLLRYNRARRLLKYRTKTYYMLKLYLQYGIEWAKQKFNELYIKETLKYIDITSTTRTVKIYDVYNVQTKMFYKINLDGVKVVSKDYLGQVDLLVTKFALLQLSKFSNNNTIRLVRNVHKEYISNSLSEVDFPDYYLLIKISKMKYASLFKDRTHNIINIRELLKDYFSRLRLGKNKTIIRCNYYKYNLIKPKRLSGQATVLFGNNRQKVIGFNFTDNIRHDIEPYLLMLKVPKLKRFKYKLRVVDYQILYNEPAMMSVFL